MPLLIGLVLALIVGGFGTALRLDRDRAFYPTITIVIASYYILFAVQAGGGASLVGELGEFALFLLAAAAGFRGSLWLVVGALIAHGLIDSIHGRLITNSGVPEWWPRFCMGYDLMAGAYLAVRLRSGAIPVRPNASAARRLVG